MTVYKVVRRYVCEDTSLVQASTRREAIKKAQQNEYAKPEVVSKSTWKVSKE